MLSFMWICDAVIILGSVCSDVDVYLGVYILMLVWNPKADETESMHVGAKYSLFQPRERPDCTFINPSLWHASFSAVIECAVFWNTCTNVHTDIWNVSFGYFPYDLIFHSSVKSHVQILFSQLLLYVKSRVLNNLRKFSPSPFLKQNLWLLMTARGAVTILGFESNFRNFFLLMVYILKAEGMIAASLSFHC